MACWGGRLLATVLSLVALGASSNAAAGADATLARHRIVVRGHAPKRVRAALAAGIEALPPAMRTAPGEPITLTWDPTPRPYGAGRGGIVSPVALSESHRATIRLGSLSIDQREELWWRRAAVHAVFARWNRARGWSRSDRWMRVALWQPGGLFSDAEPRSIDPFSVSRPEGARSPHLDLVTFAEEVFVPATALDPAALDADATVPCQERGKWRFLFETLAGAQLAPYRPHGPCPAFDSWADLEHLNSIEVLFVTASARQPESLFGHLMLRPVYDHEARVKSPGFRTVVQLVAMTSKDEGSLGYMWRGITGGFPMVVMTTTMASIRRTQLELEQRTIRRFRLELNRRERERFMDRVWELERHGTFRYRFFSDNCAAALLWLVEGALDPGVTIDMPSAPWVMPGAILDALARITVNRKGPVPLITPVAGRLLSSGDRAWRAHDRRDDIAGQLPAAIRAIHRASLDPDPLVRGRAYERLPGILATAGAPTVVYDWLALTAQIERYLADRATIARIARAKSHGRPGVAPTERLRRRRAWLRNDPSRQARLSALIGEVEPDPADTGGDLSASEKVFFRLTEIQAELIDRHFAHVDGRAWLDAQLERNRRIEARMNRQSLARSGAGRSGLGLGAVGTEPALSLSTSPLSTHLGEPMGHGYPSETEVRVLDGGMVLTPGDAWPTIGRAHMTFVGLRAIGRDVPAARSRFVDQLGWGTSIRWDRDRDRVHPERFAIQGDLFAILDNRHGAAAHTLLGAGLAAQARMNGWNIAPAAAMPLTLVHRSPLGQDLANAIRLEASWSPAALFGSWRPTFAHEALADASCDVAVGQVLGQLVVMGPALAASWGSDAGGPLALRAWLRLQFL